MSQFILAIDQGTTSTRAIVFDETYHVRGTGQQEFPQHFPRSGWVEHDPEDIWRTVQETMRFALANAGLALSDIAAIGITNQRETTILWDRASGQPIHNAIVWQDRRTAERCAAMKADGIEPALTAKTGLLLDPYFSGSKIGWILDQVPGARARAERGELAFGTVDTFLLWRLTGGRVHATFWRCSACRARSCRRCAIRPPISASPTRRWSEPPFALPASPATSTPRRSARPASGPAC